MNASTSVLERLRAATAADHEALERQLDAIERLAIPAERCRLLPRYYRMHAGADAAVARWLEAVPGLDIADRRRTPMLEADMRTLGVGAPDPSSWPPLTVSGVGEALGLLYVLEGSTLGGRMIHKALKNRGSDLLGLSFLDPYGPLTGERWRVFLEVLERHGANDVENVERGGVKGFEHAKDCLLAAETVT